MPEANTSHVELTCLQGLADLERLEGPWLEEMRGSDPKTVATTSKRLMGAMVLDRLDMELATTRLDVHNDVQGLGISTGMSTEP